MSKIVITIIITAILSSLITYTYTKKSIQSYKVPTIQPTIIDSNKVVKLHQITITPTISSNKPLFSVEILSKPYIDGDYAFSFNLKLTNLSVKPYITHFGFSRCNYIDNEGNQYKGSSSPPYPPDIIFSEKALLPNENKEINYQLYEDVLKDNIGQIFSRIPAERSTNTYKKCGYDNKGYKVCESIDGSGLKLLDCMAYVSNDKNKAKEGGKDNPLYVKFSN